MTKTIHENLSSNGRPEDAGQEAYIREVLRGAGLGNTETAKAYRDAASSNGDDPGHVEANGSTGTSPPGLAPEVLAAGGHLAALDFEDREQALAQIRQLIVRGAATDQLAGAPEPSTWAPVDLGAVLANENRKPPPVMLARADGERLVYAGKIHLFFGEPESAKGWVALLVCKEQIEAGEDVLYIDFDDEAGEAVERLLNLGLTPELIEKRFHYIRPDEPFDDDARLEVEKLLDAHEPTWAVLDGLTDALSTDGVNDNANIEVAAWMKGLPVMLKRQGRAVGIIDHVPKDSEARGGYSLGAQQKKAKCDVLFELKVTEPLGIGITGRAKMFCRKDRGGHVRPLPKPPSCRLVANVVAESDDDGNISIELEVPKPGADTGDFEPTGYMERVSRAVEADPGVNLRGLRTAVGGKVGRIDQAVGILVRDGHIREQKEGSALCHYPDKPYREPRPEPAEAEGALNV